MFRIEYLKKCYLRSFKMEEQCVKSSYGRGTELFPTLNFNYIGLQVGYFVSIPFVILYAPSTRGKEKNIANFPVGIFLVGIFLVNL